MNEVTVSFLYFDGCPLAPSARRKLLEALEHVRPGVRVRVEEVDIMDPATPDHLRRWGSPTILIDGTDVTGEPPGRAVSCRIYPGDGGAPSTREIVDAVRARQQREEGPESSS